MTPLGYSSCSCNFRCCTKHNRDTSRQMRTFGMILGYFSWTKSHHFRIATRITHWIHPTQASVSSSRNTQVCYSSDILMSEETKSCKKITLTFQKSKIFFMSDYLPYLLFHLQELFSCVPVIASHNEILNLPDVHFLIKLKIWLIKVIFNHIAM